MERYMITQSLLSSWIYTFNCVEGYEDEAIAEFMNALNRIPKEATEAMQNGIDFENLVYAIANGSFSPEFEFTGVAHPMGDTVIQGINRYPKWYTGAKAIASIIKGAPVQVRSSREIEVSGMRILVYGVLDALKAGTIYDVKFINKSMNSLELAGKYLESPQHPAYFYIVPEAMEFKYLVSDGEDVYIETYERSQTRFIGGIIAEFLASIEAMGLLPVYKEHWLAL